MSCLSVGLGDELHVDQVRNYSALMAFGEQTPNRFAAAVGVIEREFIHPHRDETIGQSGIHIASKLQRVLQSIFAIIKRELNALAQQRRDFTDGWFAQSTANGIAAHRQRQTIRMFVPPLTEVEHFMQPVSLIKELALMNQKTGVALSIDDGLDDLIEGHDLVLEIGFEDAQCEERAGQRSRNR